MPHNPRKRRELIILIDRLSRFNTGRKSQNTDLTFGEARVLAYINITMEENSKSVIALSDLAERALLAPSALSQMIRSLERRGYVVRDPDPKDRRAVLIALTTEGKEAALRLQASLEENYNKLFDVVDEKDIDELIRLLHIVTDYQEKHQFLQY